MDEDPNVVFDDVRNFNLGAEMANFLPRELIRKLKERRRKRRYDPNDYHGDTKQRRLFMPQQFWLFAQRLNALDADTYDEHTWKLFYKPGFDGVSTRKAGLAPLVAFALEGFADHLVVSADDYDPGNPPIFRRGQKSDPWMEQPFSTWAWEEWLRHEVSYDPAYEAGLPGSGVCDGVIWRRISVRLSPQHCLLLERLCQRLRLNYSNVVYHALCHLAGQNNLQPPDLGYLYGLLRDDDPLLGGPPADVVYPEVLVSSLQQWRRQQAARQRVARRRAEGTAQKEGFDCA